MANEKKFKEDIHDLLHIVVRAKEWVDMIEKTYSRHMKNARSWFEGLETKLNDIAKDLANDS